MSEIEAYFEMLKNELQRSYAYASEARKKGFDPEREVEVKIAKDVAARVENIVGPKGVAETIRNMEKNGMAREDISFEIARKIAAGEIIRGTPEELIEQAVRTGLGILTEGVLVAPTEGIAKVRIKSNPDGSDFVAVYYSGPIRSAGGTAVALSVVLADIARRVLKLADYRATDTQIERYLEEINMYESRVAHLQYKPSEEDIRHILKNCPVCIDGDPTEEIEVSAFRNVPGVETNRIRGGTPLVICEGIAQKAAKVFKYTKKLKLGWDFLEKLIKLKKDNKEEKNLKKDETYLDGLVAGRPVFSYPSRKGGFKLRYGKSKTNSLMAKNVHPATMIILDNFLAYGTHMKIEYPGKGCVVTGYEEMEPPIVKMKNGDVVKVKTVEMAYAINKDVAEILSLGDMLVPYGDFLKANMPLMPSSWCVEWFLKECEAIGINMPSIFDAKYAFEFCLAHKLPLHPDYTYEWNEITIEQLQMFYLECKKARVDKDNENITQIVFENLDAKPILEDLLIEHRVVDNKIIVEKEYGYAILASLGIIKTSENQITFDDAITISPSGLVMEILSKTSGITMRIKSPSYIGARMGRPEKGKERKMDGSPNVLFQTGSQKNRSITKIYKTLRGRDERTVNLELVNRRCTSCKKLTFLSTCEICKGETIIEKKCVVCGNPVNMKIHCDKETVCFEKKPIDMIELYDSIKKKLDISVEDVKGIKGLSNLERTPELLEKGFLRAKYGVYVFRDGTMRFDASNVPLTHFKPSEAQVSIAKLRSLGYLKDYYGNELTNENQLVSLKIQDIVIPEANGEYFLQAAKFIDDLLVNVYGLAPFYNALTKQDLIGQLTACLSPHTSAAVLCRIVGFTKANLSYAHPYLISARRRNCFDGKEKILVERNGSLELTKIMDFVESNLVGKTEIDDFGTQYKLVEGVKTYAWNKKMKKFELCNITHVSKHIAPENLVKLKTKSGRRITVTPDHKFPNSKGEKVSANEVEELIIPWNLQREIIDREDMELISSLNITDAMIRTDEKLFNEEGELSQISRSFGLNYKTFTNYIYRKSYPLELVKEFRADILASKKYILGSKRDKVLLKPTIKLDEDFFYLIGFYLAEGFTKNKQIDCYQVSLTATKEWAVDIIKEKIEKVFGIKPHVNKTHITICSRYIYELFEKLKIGRNAKTKKIPDFVYSLPNKKVIALLKGYFTGDGSCSLGNTLEVNVTSINKELIDGVSILLNFFGIKHSIYEEDRYVKSSLIIKFYGRPKYIHSYKIRIYSSEAKKFIDNIGFSGLKQEKAQKLLEKWETKRKGSRTEYLGDTFIDQVIERKTIKNQDKFVYNVTVEKYHSLICSGITTYQCDGDEDSVMLLMDTLINFSRHYLTERRGGTMDAPLVLTPQLDPKEVDDEAHCIEVVNSYPKEFYEATLKYTPPTEVKLKTVKDLLGTPEQFEIQLTHTGGYIDKGNLRTAYVTFDNMADKITTQFKLQGKIRAVDAKNAAERLILSHFIPDLYGNLRSFSRQTFRCTSCNESLRRVPLSGKCNFCGGNLILTINKGGIEKYLEISEKIIADYELPDYLKQRLLLVKKEIRSIFEDEKSRQLGLADFV